MSPLPTTALIAPQVTVNGLQLSQLDLGRLSGMKISSGLRLPARAVLRFADEGYLLSAGETYKLANAVRITMADGTLLFGGEITGVDLRLERGGPELIVTADDLAYKLALGSRVRTFTQQTFSEVVTTIAQEAGLSADIASTSTRHDYLLQTGSDLAFVTELADRVGYDWYVNDRTLVFKPPPTAATGPTLTFGKELSEFSLRASGLHPGAVTVNGWSQVQKQSVQGTATTASGLPTPAMLAPYLRVGSAANQKMVGAAESPATVDEGQQLAERLLQAWAAGAVTATGVCYVEPTLRPGVSVTVQDAGPASGSYPVTEVEHSYSVRGFETRFTAGDRSPTSLADSLGRNGSSNFRHSGMVVGVVTDVGSKSDANLVVKVKFPTLGDGIESHFARVVALGAGSRRGMTFLPEINDEVLIGFENGDIRRPVVLGGLYNGKDLATEYGVANRQVDKRRITSRLGHFIELADGSAPADQAVNIILAGEKHLLHLGKDAINVTAPAGVPISLKAGSAEISISDAGDIVIKGKSVKIDAQTDVQTHGLNVKTKADVGFEVEGTSTTLKAKAQAEISSGGVVMVKGAMVKIN
ncbi:phage baseplate assembly protein V [Nakamurella lactea]|uniref:phage baseplate assembly protein V n=1 Tax=Nakamurella lactea TaxID=459515 RepID=UPI00041F2F38|nr:phage baseplate assembly protein V [Nakamurella lactea]